MTLVMCVLEQTYNTWYDFNFTEQKNTTSIGLKNEGLVSHESWSRMFQHWLIQYSDCISLFLPSALQSISISFLGQLSLNSLNSKRDQRWQMNTFCPGVEKVLFLLMCFFFSARNTFLPSPLANYPHWLTGHNHTYYVSLLKQSLGRL